ncbi:hypothetical protein PRIPAC_93500 [Pristionchus pacificus]|uniref:Uncharacterized protein n=1 Tax=Pristionchus pacificus TaxID=54126 RepID=A0A2A6CD58_PRIPA|nr:hypothetical protein PRIPAC_93500 [Pristionchus pacificus]|eukprot:PDM76030.1 hypothetical protein PRIPAC_39634 [Pristionchus pacificus]
MWVTVDGSIDCMVDDSRIAGYGRSISGQASAAGEAAAASSASTSNPLASANSTGQQGGMLLSIFDLDDTAGASTSQMFAPPPPAPAPPPPAAAAAAPPTASAPAKPSLFGGSGSAYADLSSDDEN